MSADQYLNGIMQRNLFDKDIIATWNASANSGSTLAKKRELKVKLLGTVVAVPEQFSSALIVDEGDTYPKGYSIEDFVADDWKVVKIEQKSVTLTREGGETEVISIDDEISRSPVPKPPKPDDEDSDENIQQVDDNRFQVNKGAVRQVHQRPRGHQPHGSSPAPPRSGWRIRWVSAFRHPPEYTLADQLGIKNGDIIHSVNGQELSTRYSRRWSAYNTLKSGIGSFCFEITRRGSPARAVLRRAVSAWRWANARALRIPPQLFLSVR